MVLVRLQGVSLSVNGKGPAGGLTFSLPMQARLGVFGPPGSGKTRLLRVLAGLERPAAGRLQRAPGLRVAYLPQPDALLAEDPPPEATVREWVLGAFAGLRRLEREMRALEAAMRDPFRMEAALTRYMALQEAYETAGGNDYLARAEAVMDGLGLGRGDQERPLNRLPLADLCRVHLARCLLEDPDLLLLDDPAPCLGDAARRWLQGWLREWPGALVVASTDRAFLEALCRQVWRRTPEGLWSPEGQVRHLVGPGWPEPAGSWPA